jgi:hypothetical protein
VASHSSISTCSRYIYILFRVFLLELCAFMSLFMIIYFKKACFNLTS